MGPRCRHSTRVALQSQYAIPCSISLPTVEHAFYPYCTSGLTSPLLYPQCITHSTHTALHRHILCDISAHCAASPLLYPQCILHSTHTARPVYRHTVCVISAHCAAVVCASENNGGRDFENYNTIRRTVAEVLLCSPIVIWTSDASGRRWTERDFLHGSLL